MMDIFDRSRRSSLGALTLPKIPTEQRVGLEHGRQSSLSEAFCSGVEFFYPGEKITREYVLKLLPSDSERVIDGVTPELSALLSSSHTLQELVQRSQLVSVHSTFAANSLHGDADSLFNVIMTRKALRLAVCVDLLITEAFFKQQASCLYSVKDRTLNIYKERADRHGIGLQLREAAFDTLAARRWFWRRAAPSAALVARTVCQVHSALQFLIREVESAWPDLIDAYEREYGDM